MPKDILKNVAINKTFGPGDKLHMPRGFVHEASCSNDSPSFHATITLMTHDWSLASVYSTVLSEKLLAIPSYRLSVDRRVGSENESGNQQELVKDRLREVTETAQTVSFADISRHLQKKYKMHKDKAKEIHAAMASLPSQEKEDGVAMTITWSTQVRASTSAERQYAKATMKAASCTGISTTHRGLNIREDFADSMPFIAGKLKENLSVSVRSASI